MKYMAKILRDAVKLLSFLPCYHVDVVIVTCYRPDLAQETTHSLEAEVEKRVIRCMEIIASKVSALLVANIKNAIQKISSSYSSSCTGDRLYSLLDR